MRPHRTLTVIAVVVALALAPSPAAALNIGGLTLGSVEFDRFGGFRFVQGSTIDSEGNTYAFSWIPLFIQGSLGPASAFSSWADSDVASSLTTYRGRHTSIAPLDSPATRSTRRHAERSGPAWE
jgi:hypothetical protein